MKWIKNDQIVMEVYFKRETLQFILDESKRRSRGKRELRIWTLGIRSWWSSRCRRKEEIREPFLQHLSWKEKKGDSKQLVYTKQCLWYKVCLHCHVLKCNVCLQCYVLFTLLCFEMQCLYTMQCMFWNAMFWNAMF